MNKKLKLVLSIFCLCISFGFVAFAVYAATSTNYALSNTISYQGFNKTKQSLKPSEISILTFRNIVKIVKVFACAKLFLQHTFSISLSYHKTHTNMLKNNQFIYWHV